MTYDDATATGLQRVRSFLRQYYFDEKWEDAGTSHALRAEPVDRQERWRMAQAFEQVLGAHLPAGTLQRLVAMEANRDVLTDDEAREFLERVYEGNAFELAVDFDELERGEE